MNNISIFSVFVEYVACLKCFSDIFMHNIKIFVSCMNSGVNVFF